MKLFPGTLPAARSLAACAVAAAWVVACTPAHSTTLIRMEELPALVEESSRAALAEVVGVRYGLDEHRLHSTWLTLRIDDALYGQDVPAPGRELTVKFYGAPVTMPDGTRMFIEGTPAYERGERYLLLLRGESSHGFTNVPGLFQGAFRVLPESGETLVRSLGGNRGVFGERGLERWIDAGALTERQRARVGDPDAPVPYSMLREAVMRLWIDGGGVPWRADGAEGDTP